MDKAKGDRFEDGRWEWVGMVGGKWRHLYLNNSKKKKKKKKKLYIKKPNIVYTLVLSVVSGIPWEVYKCNPFQG